MKRSERAFLCDPWRKVQGSIYPDVVGELSKKAPTFALRGWARILVSTIARHSGTNGRC